MREEKEMARFLQENLGHLFNKIVPVNYIAPEPLNGFSRAINVTDWGIWISKVEDEADSITGTYKTEVWIVELEHYISNYPHEPDEVEIEQISRCLTDYDCLRVVAHLVLRRKLDNLINKLHAEDMANEYERERKEEKSV